MEHKLSRGSEQKKKLPEWCHKQINTDLVSGCISLPIQGTNTLPAYNFLMQ